MEPEFLQKELVRCKQHPQMVLNCINYQYNCPYKYRLACAKCLLEYETVEGFEDLLEVLNAKKIIAKDKEYPKSKQDLLNEYFKILEQNEEEYIKQFTEEIFQQIHKLQEELQVGTDKYYTFRAEIVKIQKQFNDTYQLEQLRDAFKTIFQVENYHESQVWDQLEEIAQSFVLQFEDQLQNELNEACKILQEKEQEFLLPQLQSTFQRNVIKKEVQKLQLGVFPVFTSLCDKLQQFELIQRIQDKKDVQPRVTLLFQGSKHGMNAKSFWEKCSNKGPTLIFCKSKNGHVFGGYTPCKWVTDLCGYQNDDSKSSFLFSLDPLQFYPIVTWEQAICCNSNSLGPAFGNGALQVSYDFQNGSSNLDGYLSEGIENPRTHLMGGVKPELVEMEVFQII